MSFDKTVTDEDIKKSGFEGDAKFDEQLSSHTTFKIGGAARVFLSPTNIDSLFAAVALADGRGLPYFVLGGGSNVVFADDGFAGIVISTQNLGGVSLSQAAAACETDCLVRCGAGAAMAEFVSFCTENALSGAEEFAGLPGTVGGAVYMNARCFDKSISDLLYSIEYIDLDASASAPESAQSSPSEKNLQTADVSASGAERLSAPSGSISETANAIAHSESVPAGASLRVLPSEWGYKKSPFQNTRRVITAATFRLRRAAPASEQISPSESISPSAQIASRCAYFISEREKRGHFRYPSAGSVFKNNRAFGAPSGKLVEEAGLRGAQIGGAQIAPWHGNFIINTGCATACDVRALVDLATEKVRGRTGFAMETEIIFVP